jgi:hypothetical protein
MGSIQKAKNNKKDSEQMLMRIGRALLEGRVLSVSNQMKNLN